MCIARCWRGNCEISQFTWVFQIGGKVGLRDLAIVGAGREGGGGKLRDLAIPLFPLFDFCSVYCEISQFGWQLRKWSATTNDHGSTA